MQKTLIAVACSAALAVLSGCGQAPSKSEETSQNQVQTPTSSTVEQSTSNSLLADWTGPFKGVPAFDKMNMVDLPAAMEAGIAEQLAEFDAIATQQAPATFENTIVAMEKSGKTLDRVYPYYGIWRSNMSSAEFREIQGQIVPKLSAFRSKITQNEALFQRIEAVYKGEEFATLTPAQQRLTQISYDRFARNGATLEGEAKQRYADIQAQLAELHTQFGNNVLHDEQSYVVYLTKEQLGGLPESFIKAASSAAEAKGEAGKYAITNTRSSMSPFLTYSTERELREQVWTNYYSRGDNGGEHDNNAIIAEILKLRDERVGLLGYDNYAEWRLEDRMAKHPDNAMTLMEQVWPAAIARVAEEVADMQAIADADGADITIKPWDYRFYAEKVRQAKYDLDSNEVKQYLQLDKLREAMFYVAGRVFNFEFTPITDGSVPVFHDDVAVWQVTQKQTGELVGLWYLDPFAREGKRSGAWATTYRSHELLTDDKPVVLASNNSNFVKGSPGEPVLVSWDDAETFFHEFGHALHYLSSDVAYPTLNGGVRDYTEFQSQLLERWLSTDEVISQFLTHVDTGAPMPADLQQKIKNAATFNQGFATTEYLASALIDMKLHTTDPTDIDPDAFERDTLTAMGMPTELVMRHRTPHFGHIFSGEGYSAGYYGYMWAEVLTSDAGEAFAEAPGGYYDEAMAEKLRQHLFSVQNSVDPAEAYRAFRGADANVEALMRDRGFPLPSAMK
ncbi:M3 family metallopeptidase [Neiella marina]|uniref:oligopeptidase A n=1 Tax=Neiella holothuriorum TaxID=2870530 RepID=A0ABS7EFL9_9GAMM|nr:M3 family metallopeptidase [Neiella holothuriorum]MBW8191125.1 M3 family metallopeptidase [Neiella holothuriorum]